MRLTSEQREARAQFIAVVRAVHPRARVVPDPEGWPIVPGRLGQLEWFCDGTDCHSCPIPQQPALAVYTSRSRVIPRLQAPPRRGADGRRHGDGGP